MTTHRTIALLLVALAASAHLCIAHAAERPPNVVFIFADDLGYGDVGCYGATKVKTPNIDRLAKEGRMFTDAHSASAGLHTLPRYGLLTGDYPFRQGTGGQWGPLSHTSGLIIDTNRLTMGKLFKDEGYSTACVGKWHLGFGTTPCNWNKPLRPGPLELGFDYYFGVPKVNSGFPYVYVENDRIVGWDPKDPLRFKGKPISPTPTFPEKYGRKSPNAFAGARKAHEIYDDERTATLLTEKSIAWIKKEKEKPFFLYLATTNIHHPFTPHPRFKDTSECGLYGDFIHELDWMVGEVLKTLDEEGLAKNTMVIFTSDNGGMYNTGGQAAWKAGHKLNGEWLGFKFGAWEGGHRIPLVVRWPGHVTPGSTSKQLLSSVDMMATMAALLDRKLKDTDAVDSFNMLEAIVGEPKKPIRDHLIACPFRKSNLALRKGKWLYIGATKETAGLPATVAAPGPWHTVGNKTATSRPTEKSKMTRRSSSFMTLKRTRRRQRILSKITLRWRRSYERCSESTVDRVEQSNNGWFVPLVVSRRLSAIKQVKAFELTKGKMANRAMKHIVQVALFIVACVADLGMNAYGQATGRWDALYEPQVFEGMPCRVMKPLGFDPSQSYPVIVSLHGAGGRGTNNDRQLKDWNRQLAEQQRRKDFPCYVVAPQAAELWSAQHLEKIKSLVKRLPSVDRDRIYILGHSMGGHGTYIFIQLDPGYFAAAAPSAGSGLKRTAAFIDLARIKDVPIWAFHGDRDGACPIAKDREVLAAMKKLGGNMKLTTWVGDKHAVSDKMIVAGDNGTTEFSSDRCDREPDFMTWLFAQSRKSGE